MICKYGVTIIKYVVDDDMIYNKKSAHIIMGIHCIIQVI